VIGGQNWWESLTFRIDATRYNPETPLIHRTIQYNTLARYANPGKYSVESTICAAASYGSFSFALRYLESFTLSIQLPPFSGLNSAADVFDDGMPDLAFVPSATSGPLSLW
jgi:hypothetical protein